MTGNLFDSPQSGKAPSSGWLIAHCDGGSRGNPGPSGYGAVLEDESGQIVARLSQFLGIQTNNYAEYSGLLAVLRWAHEHGRSRLRVISDSELMVKQMKGIYKVSSPGLRPLWEEAKKLARQLEKFEMSHTLRGGNKEADRLANEAMDRGMGKNRDQETGARDQAGSRQQAAGSTPAPIRANAYEKPPARPGQTSQAQKPPRQTLEGYVKGGVVHIIEGELPDGIFVKIIRE
jgi:probable phosphoglycerate mutase